MLRRILGDGQQPGDVIHAERQHAPKERWHSRLDQSDRRRHDLLDAPELPARSSNVAMPEVEIVDADLFVELTRRIRGMTKESVHQAVAVPHEIATNRVTGRAHPIEP